jgi:hypothetical protein
MSAQDALLTKNFTLVLDNTVWPLVLAATDELLGATDELERLDGATLDGVLERLEGATLLGVLERLDGATLDGVLERLEGATLDGTDEDDTVA